MSRRRNQPSQLVTLAEEQGFRVQATRKGWRVLAPDGKRSACLHKTPSDHRTFKNTVADLRRIGVEL